MNNNLRQAAQAALEALDAALPIIQYDAQMMADITRHAPLDPKSQAEHDSTEYASERLVRTIPPLIDALRAALAEPQSESPADTHNIDARISAIAADRDYWREQATGPQPGPVAEVYDTFGNSKDPTKCSGHVWLATGYFPPRGTKLYAAPQAQRQPLTAEQVWANDEIMSRNRVGGLPWHELMRMVRSIEAAHGIGVKP